MEQKIILSVKFREQCKLIAVNGDSSFAWFESQVRSTWDEIQSLPISFVYSVGSYMNTCLSCEDDLMNLMVLCRLLNFNLVDVTVSCNSDNVQNDLHNSMHASLETNQQSTSKDTFSNIDDSNSPDPAKKRKIGNGLDLNGTFGSLPLYDICPRAVKTPMLSDSWVNIMDGGVGTVFVGGVVQFRTELIKHATSMGFNYNFIRNNTKYVHVVCKEIQAAQCQWFIKAKIQPVTKYFVVYKACLSHTCICKLVKDESGRLCPRIMADFFLQNVKNRPSIGGREIVNLMQIDYGIEISYSKAWRTIESARNVIFGRYDDSYDQLAWYCKAITRTNPGSIVHLEHNMESQHFERLFVAFKACIDGFQFCRPMLFIDGTFMKGRAQGTLLVATAKDGDNGLFPIAFAVVSSENTANWVWFLENLRDGVKHKRQIFYLSDRNCGLMSAFNIVFKEPVHFFCIYHLLSNLKGRFSSGWTNLKRAKMGEHFKECAYAPNRRLFDEKLAIFKEVGGCIAEEWLEQLPVEKWAVAYSPQIIRYGEMTSNAAESFNSWILNARSKPITQMIDEIREGICRWFVERRNESNNWTGALVPNKEDLWLHLSDISRSWFVSECPGGNYEVSSSPSVSVNLELRTCTCY